MSVRLRLSLIIGGLLVVVLATDFYFINQRSSDILAEYAKIKNQEKTNYTRQIINLYFNRAQEDLTNLSNDSDIAKALEVTNQQIAPQVIEKLTITKKTIGVLESIGLHKVNGSNCLVALASEDSLALVGRDFSDRDFCQGIIKNKSPYISSTFNSAITNNLVLGLAVPVKNNVNELTGYIVGIIDLNQLRGYLWDLQSNSSFVVLLDRYGQNFLDTRNQEEQKNQTVAELVEKVNQTKGQSGFFIHQKHLVNFTRLGFATVISSESVNNVFEVVNQISWVIAIANILVIILLLLVTFFSISFYANRLKIMAKVAKRNTVGDKIIKIDEKYLKSKDDVSVLAVAFNQMLDTLQELKNDLEKKVKERTDKLEKSEMELKKALRVAEKTNKLMVGRELKMIELKKELAK
ncbi:MAG: hypothetical protein WCW26_04475, partial [Candidatus Buchananbacteria bacterium]